MRLVKLDLRYGARQFASAMRLLLVTLREIFDESAYARFLMRHGLSSSSNSYAAFLQEQDGARARHPKCC
jgi:hypothetical protein